MAAQTTAPDPKKSKMLLFLIKFPLFLIPAEVEVPKENMCLTGSVALADRYYN